LSARFLIPLSIAALVVGLGGSAQATRGSTPSLHLVTYSGKKPRASSARAAVPWCGTGESTANRTPDVELSSVNQVHVWYAVPSDGADQFSAYASLITSGVANVDAWWQGQDPTRTPRFDLFAFPGCGSKYGMLDLGFVRLPGSSASYATEAGLSQMALDASRIVAPTNDDKDVIFYDGPDFDPRVCGVSFDIPGVASSGGLAGLNIDFLRSLCGSDLGGNRLADSVTAHELIHGLGALWQPGAPNECTVPDQQGHVCDSTLDILYPFVTSNTTLPTQILDFGRNDYYGHSNPALYDVQDSSWLSHLPQFPLAITVSSKGGAATGTVAMTQPAAGFTCTSSCTASLDNGTQAALATQPGANSKFVGWGGACVGAGGCNLTMDGAKTISAVFGPATFTLSVSVAGKGRVTSTPAGIACPTRCSSRFAADGSVRLQAKPKKGFKFAGWSGACRGTGGCTVKIDRNRSARATFKAVKKKKKKKR
jgi:hypothetical protein